MHVEAALASLDALYQAMPPVAALGLRSAGFDGDCLRLHAPLAANINDKGCAFGGSLASLMTLAGWGLVNLRLQQAGVQADVFVADSQLRYRAPLYADLEAGARLAEGASWDAFLARLRERGRASIRIAAWVALPDGHGVAADCTARFVAIDNRYDPA
ncbi:YiiD C-terminal domain-containing protein [Cognatiluteimonas profundi]|uniref:YiiD C-terminal domain-containing protein n=1 Tax=Cognatiluteimonas profundi TaxID=2594501 RepID=UPI00131D9F1D|nr:YiiD C-terminal domain-containing protein [Lysobacter profundi]